MTTTGTVQHSQAQPRTAIIAPILISSSILLLVFAGAYMYLPADIVDWSVFRAAALEMLSLRTPYAIEAGYYNPPWVLLPLMPLALLPERAGAAALLVVGMVSYAYTTYRMGGNKLAVIAVLLSPPIIADLLLSNINWLVVLGFFMPARIGLFFVLAKPQLGLAVAIYWLFDSFRSGGVKQVIRDFLPVSLAFALSFLLFGNWIGKATNLIDLTYNLSMWPASIPVGIALLVYAVREKSINASIIAAPLLSPYALLYAYAGAMIALSKRHVELTVLVVGFWVLIITQLTTIPI